MFVVLLRFGKNRARAIEFMAAHEDWIGRGIKEGAFLVVGSLQPRLGGAIVAHRSTRSELESRLALDPFVANGVVDVEVLEIAPSKVDDRPRFLLA
jgi:uncharacterized protein YciI